jgi:hypothetical protein
VTASCASADVRPLLSAGRRVIVDGHAICDACGRAVELVAPQRWRHGKGAAPAPVTLAALRGAPTYAAFRAKFPRFCEVPEDAWRGAVQRLERYASLLDAAARSSSLSPHENPCLSLFELISAAPSPLLDLAERRREMASLFCWAIPTEAALEVLARHAPLVECGAGMGYWTALLRSRGVDALAYDLRPPGRKARNRFHRTARGSWTPVARASSVHAARRHPERALVLCWPPYGDDAASYAALRAYRGDTLIHIGEREEGATGSVRFHRELALNWTLVEELALPRWPRLRDSVLVYRRNARRLPLRERDRCFECGRFIATGAIGRCDACFERRPPALALRAGRHRIEYPQDVVDAMPEALRRAFERSPGRIRTGCGQRNMQPGR